MSDGFDFGGQAFPIFIPADPEDEFGAEPVIRLGMTLRDYFAAKALAGLVTTEFAETATTDLTATEAYLLADAMLKARQA